MRTFSLRRYCLEKYEDVYDALAEAGAGNSRLFLFSRGRYRPADSSYDHKFYRRPLGHAHVYGAEEMSAC